MAAAKHTPGPWVYGEREPRTGRIQVWSQDGIATGVAHAFFEPDAKLIAAAPALADALEKLVAAFEDENLPDCTAALKESRVALRTAGRLP